MVGQWIVDRALIAVEGGEMEDEVVGVIQYLLANPIFLAPILLIVAMLAFALIKKLLKMAAIVAIAGGLYVLLVQYFGPGI